MLKNKQFWLAVLVLIIVGFIAYANYNRWWDWRYDAGPFTTTHWLGWIGAGYLAIFNPVYSYIKRHTSGRRAGLLSLHVFSNLAAFLLVTVHYTQQTGRPAEFAAVHSTGLVLYIIVASIVITGFLRRFVVIRGLLSTWRFVHVSLTLSLYIVLIIHILQFYDLL